MSIPTGLVCAKCGKVFGAITNPPPEKLIGLTAICASCFSEQADVEDTSSAVGTRPVGVGPIAG